MTPRGPSLFIDVSTEIAGHLAFALNLHRDWAVKSGMERPPELDQFAKLFASRAIQGQRGTPLADLWAARDREVVTRRLFTYDEAATALCCSSRTVKRLVATGALPAVQVGGTARIRVSDLDSYVEHLPRTHTPSGAS